MNRDVRIPQIPPFIKEQYGGTARGFKATKRAQINAVIKAVNQLRMGAAYLPGGSARVSVITDELQELLDECSARNWGR